MLVCVTWKCSAQCETEILNMFSVYMDDISVNLKMLQVGCLCRHINHPLNVY